MDSLLRLFDLFNNTAKTLAGYLPQNGPELIAMFRKALDFAAGLNVWLIDNIGVNFQAALAPLGKLVFLSANFLLELVRGIVARL